MGADGAMTCTTATNDPAATICGSLGLLPLMTWPTHIGPGTLWRCLRGHILEPSAIWPDMLGLV